jgi:hypothetical protein
MVTVDGFVLDNNNNPVENATIVLPLQHLFALSGEDGYFIIPDVTPGIHTIYAIQRYYDRFETDVNLSEDMTVTINLDRKFNNG